MSICKNVGSVDRAVRGTVGLLAIVLAFTVLGVLSGSVAGLAAAAVGVVLLTTSIAGMCPLYVPFGLTTCPAVRR
jgi:hypothetical protein